MRSPQFIPMLPQVMTKMSSCPDPAASTVAPGRSVAWHRALPIPCAPSLWPNYPIVPSFATRARSNKQRWTGLAGFVGCLETSRGA